ncbi:MAG: translocation/assembly module TamB [Alphaproteobacteria bacterium]|nr:MAG: translocation/assembly module TamB [Alphaproteobacteria bacterium]
MRPWQKKLLIAGATLVGAGSLLIAALQLPSVQQRILDKALHVAAQQTDTHIRLEGTHGFFPWTLQADRLRVAQADHELLDVSGLVVRWSPMSLLRKQIIIDEVRMGAASFWQPLETMTDDPEAVTVPDLSAFPSLRVTNFQIERLAFHAPNARAQHFKFLGGFELMPNGQVLRFDLTDLDTGAERIQLVLDHSLEADRLDLSADIDVTDQGVLGGLLGSLDAPRGKAKLVGSGPASNWQGHLSFEMGTALGADLDLTCACNRTWSFSLKGSAQGTALAALDQALGNEAPLDLGLVLAGEGLSPQLTLKDLQITKGDFKASAGAEIDFAPEAGAVLTFDLTALIKEIGREELQAYLPLRISAEGTYGQDGGLILPRLAAETDFGQAVLADFTRARDGAMAGRLQAEVISDQLPNVDLAALELGSVSLSGDLAFSPAQIFTLSKGRFVADARALEGQVDAVFDIPSETLHLESAATVQQAITVQGRSVELQGAVRLTANASEFTQSGQLALQLELPALLLDHENVPPLHLDASVEGIASPQLVQVALTSEGSTPWLSELDLTLQWQANAASACSGELRLHVRGLDMSGDAQGCLIASNPFAGGTAALQGQSLRWLETSAGEVSANLDWSLHDADRFVGSASGAGKDLNLGGLLVPEAQMSVQASRVGETLAVKVETFEVSLREADYSLAAPFDLTWAAGAIDLTDVRLNSESEEFGAGSLTISDLRVGEEISAAAAFDNLPLVAIPAKLDGSARLSLSARQVEGDVALALTSRLDGVPPTKIFLKSDWRDGRIAGGADISFGSEEAAPSRVAHWHIPLEVSRGARGWTAQVGQASAEFEYDGPIDPLIALLPIYAHEVSGHLVLEGDLQVRSDGPYWQGSAVLSEASYAYARGGVALDRISATATASGQGMKMSGAVDLVQKGPAADGDGSDEVAAQLIGKGTFDFSSFESWKTAIDLQLNDSPLLHHASYQGRASGDLTLQASPAAATLKGDILFDTLDIQIPPPGPAEVIPLKIVPVDANGVPLPTRETRKSTTWLPGLDLDVTLEAKNRLMLTGRGINTEWQAKGALKGPASAAAVSGSMEALRGTIEFGGRVFEIERGAFDLVNGDLDGAQIDLQASYGAPGGTTARILVGGTVGTPKISFASTPPLPEEEIVALVLFGKPLAQLGPLEVLRTGTAVAQISGRAGGYDGGLVTRMRRSLGIDYLSIDPTGGGGETPVVTAGKYIGKGVFLKVIQGLGDFTGALSVEYAVTDEITLSTEVNEVFQSEAAIEWKRDY